MLSKTIIAASALLSLAAAVPLQQVNRRDVVWETSTSWDVTTMHVTTTVWLQPGETAPSAAEAPQAPQAPPAHFGHGHHHKKPKHTAQPASPSPPAEQTSPYGAPSPTTPASAPTTTAAPPPAETTTPVASPSPKHTASPKPQPSSAPSGGSYPSDGLTGAAAAGQAYTGDFTWYQTGLGACGWTSQPSDHIVAISEDLFDQYATANPNDNPTCGKMLTLTGVDGTQYSAKIVDRCTGCALSDLDLSEDFFNLVTSNGNGRVSGMHWVFD